MRVQGIGPKVHGFARAQAALENFVPVRLELWIKVRKDWRKDPRSLKEFGYLS